MQNVRFGGGGRSQMSGSVGGWSSQMSGSVEGLKCPAYWGGGHKRERNSRLFTHCSQRSQRATVTYAAETKLRLFKMTRSRTNFSFVTSQRRRTRASCSMYFAPTLNVAQFLRKNVARSKNYIPWQISFITKWHTRPKRPHFANYRIPGALFLKHVEITRFRAEFLHIFFCHFLSRLLTFFVIS